MHTTNGKDGEARGPSLLSAPVVLASCAAFYLFLKIAMLAAGRAFFDEGVYIGIARYFASWGSAGVFESIRPLGIPLLLAPLQPLPFDPLVTGRILCLLLTLAGIPLMYRIGKAHASREAGLWCAALYASSAAVLVHGGLILTDVPAFALTVLAVSLARERSYLLSGAALGAAFLLKFPVLLAALPCLGLIAWQERGCARAALRGGARFALALALAVSPFVLFHLLHNDGPLLARVLAPLMDAASIVDQDTWLYTPTSAWSYLLALALTELPIVAGTSLAIGSAHARRKHLPEILALCCCAALFLAYFSTGVARFDHRYVLALALPLLPLAGIGIASACERASSRRAAGAIGAAFLAAMVLTASASALLVARDEYPTDPEVPEAIARAGSLATNSGFALVAARGPARLTPGPNLDATYAAYALDPSLDTLALDIGEYPCPKGDAQCEAVLEARVNRITQRNTVRACGLLHGRRMLVLGKEDRGAAERGVDAQECLARLGMRALPPEPTRTFVRINEAQLSSAGALERRVQIERLVRELDAREVPVVLVLAASSLDPGEDAHVFLSGLPASVALGVTPAKDADEVAFAARLEELTGREIEVFVPEGDDWGARDELPAGAASCIRGPWDQAITPLPCRTIDLYTAPEGKDKGLGDIDALLARYLVLQSSDIEIGVDIHAALLDEEGYAALAPLIVALVPEAP